MPTLSETAASQCHHPPRLTHNRRSPDNLTPAQGRDGDVPQCLHLRSHGSDATASPRQFGPLGNPRRYSLAPSSGPELMIRRVTASSRRIKIPECALGAETRRASSYGASSYVCRRARNNRSLRAIRRALSGGTELLSITSVANPAAAMRSAKSRPYCRTWSHCP